MGLEPGEAARATVLAARLATDIGLAEPADVDRLALLQQLGAVPQPEAASA
jgi:hypothetical protein